MGDMAVEGYTPMIPNNTDYCTFLNTYFLRALVYCRGRYESNTNF